MYLTTAHNAESCYLIDQYIKMSCMIGYLKMTEWLPDMTP